MTRTPVGTVLSIDVSALADELTDVACKLIYFASPAVTAVRRPTAQRLEIEVETSVDPAGLVRDVDVLIGRLRAGYRPLQGKRLFAREAQSPGWGHGAADTTARLLAAGLVRRLGAGSWSFAPAFVALLETLDDRLRRAARRSLGATERAFSALLSTDVLRRAGFVTSFPQNVSFVSHLPQRLDALLRFQEANVAAGRLSFPDGAGLEEPRECLPPAVCYHRFHELAESVLTTDDTITARGTCFRYEARHNMSDLTRLWSFQMREIVFTGSDPFVRASLTRAASVLETLAADLGVSAVCETATDPFFINLFAQKRYAQLAQELKFELRVPLGGDDSLAVASLNLHQDFFGRAFAVGRADGAPIASGCLAFGLERLALGFLAQHGPDAAAWPAAIAAPFQERMSGGGQG